MTVPKLWQRLAMNPEGSLQLLDAAFWLKFAAWRDRGLRQQLASAWTWCFQDSAPSRSLAPRSAKHARDVGRSQRQQWFPETDRENRLAEALAIDNAPRKKQSAEASAVDAPPGQKESV